MAPWVPQARLPGSVIVTASSPSGSTVISQRSLRPLTCAAPLTSPFVTVNVAATSRARRRRLPIAMGTSVGTGIDPVDPCHGVSPRTRRTPSTLRAHRTPPFRDENAGIAQPRIDPATRSRLPGAGIGRCRRVRSDAGAAWASDTIRSGGFSVGCPAAAGNSTRAWSHVTSQTLEGHHARSTQRHGRRPAGSHPSTAGRPARGSGIDLLDLVTGIGDGVAVRGRGIAAVVIAVAGARGSRLP